MMAAKELEARQHLWILDAAYKHYAEKIEAYRVEKRNHLAAIAEGSLMYWQVMGVKQADRQEQITHLDRWIGEYQTMLEWMDETIKLLREQDSQEFAKGVGDFMRSRHGIRKAEPKRSTRKAAKG